MRNQNKAMTKKHPRWEEFIDRLTGPEGCNLRVEEDGEIVSKCKGGTDKTFAIRILRKMGSMDIKKSVEYFESNSGFCDCEIIFNVGWADFEEESEEYYTSEVPDSDQGGQPS